MEQKEFVRHPIYTNYEASRDGVIRHCRQRKPLGNLNNSGYFTFNIGGKKVIVVINLYSNVILGLLKMDLLYII